MVVVHEGCACARVFDVWKYIFCIRAEDWQTFGPCFVASVLSANLGSVILVLFSVFEAKWRKIV